jgi:F-type H+-transporting ATPase subunit alpha
VPLNINEISKVIEKQIKEYGKELVHYEEGTVASIGDGVALLFGLDKRWWVKLLEFPHGVYGMVLNLEEVPLVPFWWGMIH